MRGAKSGHAAKTAPCCCHAGMSAAASAAAAQQILFRRGQQQRGGAFESRPPTQGESRRWERSGRFSKKVLLRSP